jgi:hypothetical protein
MGGRCLVALRQLGLQQFQPDLLTGVTLASGVTEGLADGFQLLLQIDAVVAATGA